MSRKPPPPGPSLRISPEAVWFFAALAGLLALTAKLAWDFHLRPPLQFIPVDPIVPTFQDFSQAVRLVFDGYKSGYARTALAFAIHAAQAAFFLSAGGFLMRLMFPRPQAGEAVPMGPWLWAAFAYLLGSLFSSLLWFGLGSLGILNRPAALAVCAAGVGLFARQAARCGAGKVRAGWSSWKTQWALSEKALSLAAVFLLLLYSLTAFRQPVYTDPLMTHLALPNYYIHQGSLAPNPHHFHSYYPGNTEMLALWSLLLGSDMAAGLTIWGFLAVFVILVWSWIKARAGPLTGWVAAFLLLSAPIVGQSAIAVKNDLPMALFSFAHYCALVEALDRRQDPGQPRPWVVLAGLLCGGAVCHKMSALPMAGISTLLVLACDVLGRNPPGRPKLFPWWVLGFSIAAGPWFLRTFLLTGNPVYPLLHGLFGGEYLKPSHSSALIRTFGLASYAKNLLVGSNLVDGPSWGPSIAFASLSVPVWLAPGPAGAKACLAAAALTYAFMLNFHLGLPSDPRYHVGVLSFLVLVPFALTWGKLLRSGLRASLRGLAYAAVALCFAQVFATTNMSAFFLRCATSVLSGYSDGNFAASKDDADNLKWLCHLVNKHTPAGDGVLFAGVMTSYGLHRRTWFNFSEDREVLADFAAGASGPLELEARLRRAGVHHILLSSTFYDAFRGHPDPRFRIAEGDLQCILGLVRDRLQARFVTPNKKVFWFSLRQEAPLPEVQLDREDAREFPVMFIEQAKGAAFDRDPELCMRMLKMVLDAPIYVRTRVFGHNILALLHKTLGNPAVAEDIFRSTIEMAPRLPDPYLNLALFYLETGREEKVPELVRQALQRGGRTLIRNTPVLSRYL